MNTSEHDIEIAATIRDNELESSKTTIRKQTYTQWGLTALLAIATIGNIYQGTQHRWIIRYVEVDKASMQARVIDPAAERYEPSQAIVKSVLSSYVRTLRYASEDRQAMDDDLNVLRICSTPAARQRIRTYETTPDAPKQQRFPREVQIISKLALGARSYTMRWQEWKYGQDKRQDGPPTFYSARLTFERRDPKTEQELTNCPTGIFLDEWTLGKDQ